MATGEFTSAGNPTMEKHPIQGGGGVVEIPLAASCYGNRDKLRPDGPLGLKADITYPTCAHGCFGLEHIAFSQMTFCSEIVFILTRWKYKKRMRAGGF